MSVVFTAEKREDLGSAATKRVRKAGRIPAVIYSKKGNINVSLDRKEFEKEYFKGIIPSTVVDVELDGKKIKAIGHDITLDPVSDRPTHIDFLNCDESKTVRAKPKLTFINKDKSPGLKRGAFLHVVLRRVEVICDNAETVPHEITVDVGALQVGAKIKSDAAVLPAGVAFAAKKEFLLGSIIGRGKAAVEETPAEGGAEEAAAEESSEA